MLLRTRVTQYAAPEIKNIKDQMLEDELAQNVQLSSDLIGDFVQVTDCEKYLKSVAELQHYSGCKAVVEVNS